MVYKSFFIIFLILVNDIFYNINILELIYLCVEINISCLLKVWWYRKNIEFFLIMWLKMVYKLLNYGIIVKIYDINVLIKK